MISLKLLKEYWTNLCDYADLLRPAAERKEFAHGLMAADIFNLFESAYVYQKL
jgi:hypothetical protein